MRIKILILCLLFAIGANAEYKFSLVEVPITSKTTPETLGIMGLDIVEYDRRSNSFRIAATPSDLAKLLAGGINFSLLIDDMEAFYASRLDPSELMGGYHTYAETVAEINQLHNDFPAIVGEPYSIGQSIEERELWVVKISDNPEIDEDEPEVFYNSLIHAREPITVELLLTFMHYLTDNYPTDPEVAYLVENREMFFLPVFNPDGYVHNEVISPSGGGMWRKNMRDNDTSGTFQSNVDGVDLNRNFGYMWGYDNYGSSPYFGSATYRGTGPFSEPETDAVRDFVDAREFTVAFNYHSYSNLYLHAWGYDYLFTDDHDLFTELGEKLSEDNGYLVGPGWMHLYLVNGEADDWMYGDTTHSIIISYVVEVGGPGDGFWPPESRIDPLCAENLGPNLLLAHYADNPWRVLKPNTPVITPVDTVSGVFTLTWDPATDPDNPPIGFVISELRGREVVINDLEDDPGDEWIVDGFIWSAVRSNSGFYSCYSDSINHTNTILTAVDPWFVNAGDTLSFWTWYEIEVDWDYGYVQVSTDGGCLFDNLEGNITTNSNPHNANQGNGITGSSGGWVYAQFDLSDYENQVIILRFNYDTDHYVLEEGWYIDDIYPWMRYDSDTTLVQSHPDTFLSVDPGSDPGLVYYRARAVDNEGDYSMWCNPEEALVNLTGYFAEGWHLFSPPLEPDYPQIDSIFGNDISGTYYIFDYTPHGGYFLVDSVELGEGYWLALEDTCTIGIEGEAAADSTAIGLCEGWNLVGAAWQADYPRDSLNFSDGNLILPFIQAVDSTWIAASFYGFDNQTGSYTLEDTLESWRGYWLNALAENLQMITYPLQSGDGGLIAVKDEFIKHKVDEEFDDWAVSIILSQGEIYNDISSLGMHSDASDGYDVWFDYPLPPTPPGGDYVRLVFAHPEWNSPVGDAFCTDVRSLPEDERRYMWTFRIEASESGPITVNFKDIAENLPAGYTAIAAHGNHAVDLLKKHSFTFDYSSPCEVTVELTGCGISSGGVEEGMIPPGEYSLAGIYPNPFNPTTLIRIGLPEASELEVSAYNILGRRVAKLTEGWRPSGWHNIVFDASRLSCGIYFIKVEASDKLNEIRKVVLVK